MRRIESISDEMNGVVTYEIAGGKRIQLDIMAVAKFGAEALIRGCGGEPYGVEENAPQNIPVYQRDKQIGWMDRSFDPMFTRSLSMFYDIRRSDFKREGDKWVACPSICPGDFDAIPTFRRIRADPPPAKPVQGVML